MKKIYLYLVTLMCILFLFPKPNSAQPVSEVDPYERTTVEFDKFIYATSDPRALSYEFRIRTANGMDKTITKDVNYFCLNELDPEDILYGEEYFVMSRAVTAFRSNSWGIEQGVQTVSEPVYHYGKIRLYFRQDEFFKFSSFFKADDIVQNDEIENFNDLAHAAGITEFNYPIRKFLELSGKNPMSCVDLSFNNNFSIDSLINFFSPESFIELPEPHYMYKLGSIPPEYNASNSNFWHLKDIDAPQAWNITDGDRQNVIIAVIDNVFDIDHIDIRKNIYVNMGEVPAGILSDYNRNGVIDADDLFTYYYSRGYRSLRQLFANPPRDEIFNGRDNDGNGYIDDICGWNVANNNNRVTPYHTNGSFLGHGTHVAGIAGAVSGNGGICALANNNVRIVPLSLSNGNRNYSESNCIDPMAAIEYILNMEEKPQIISMSFGGPALASFEEALILLEERYKVLSVAATGNNSLRNFPQYPAYYENVIAVGASTNNNMRADFSNYGDNMPGTYVLAPGKNIYSTNAGEINQRLYSLEDGTSMACPLVSSLAGLLYSQNPDITPATVRQLIECGCNNNPRQLSNYDPANDGYGKINAYQSLLCLERMAPVAEIRENFEFYCTRTSPYRFDGVSLTSTDNCSYQWLVSGGNYLFEGGNAGQYANIRFMDLGVYTITLIISNPNGSSTSTIEIEVKNPSVTILNGPETESCTGNSAKIYIELEGTPPFTVRYTFNGLLGTVQNINTNNHFITINTNSLTAGSSHIFTIEYMNDANNCSNNDPVRTTVNVRNCESQCEAKYNQIWHMNPVNNSGQVTRGVYFNPGPQLVPNVFDPVTDSRRGSASISDYNGNPVLSFSAGNIYSTKPGCDGVRIATNVQNMGGMATQKNLILPNRLNNNKYYVLTISGITAYNFGISWGVVDFTNSPCGTYTFLGTHSNNDYEKMTACYLDGENGYWIITYSSNKFNLYKLFEDNDMLVYEGFEYYEDLAWIGEGEMKFDLGMEYLATAFYMGRRINLYRFNRDVNFTGNRLELIGEKTMNSSPYSVEFSPNGEMLYCTAAENLLQIPVSTFNTSEPVIIHRNPVRMYGLILAPDMKIYTSNYPNIGIITDPNLSGTACGFVDSVMYNPFSFNFPPRIPSLNSDFKLEYYIEDCSTRIRCTDISGGDIISYNWFSGPNTPEITVDRTGLYAVTVLFSNGCSVTRNINITADRLYTPMYVQDVRLHHVCDNLDNGFINVILRGGRAPYTYRWENQHGDIIGDRLDLYDLPAGTYYLTVTDGENCELTTQQTIHPSMSPVVDTEVLSNICGGGQNGSARLIFDGLVNYYIQWSNGERAQTAVNLRPGINTVTVTDANGCYTTAEVEILNVNADPYFQANESCIFTGNRELYFYPVNIPREEWDEYSFAWEISGTVVSDRPEYYPDFEYEGFYCISLTASRGECTGTHSERIYVYPSDCYCDNSNYDALSIIIEEDTHWTGRDIYIRDELIVKPGATLILKNCKLLFGPAGRLVIEPWAKVIGVGTLFTSLERGGCDHMWYGIEVHGNHMMASTHSSQGRLELQDGSMIKNAI